MDRIRTRHAPLLRASGKSMWRFDVARNRRPLVVPAVVFSRLVVDAINDPRRRRPR